MNNKEAIEALTRALPYSELKRIRLWQFGACNPRTGKWHWDDATARHTRPAAERRRVEAVANLRAAIRADIESEIQRLQSLVSEV